MDLLESAFLSKTQKLNEKRQELLLKKYTKLLPELEQAYEKGDNEEVEGILKSIQIPSGKEWRKHIASLVDSSAKNGVLRAHVELLRMKELYEFNEYDWSINVVDEGADFEVTFPPEAQEWIRKYGYEIGTITEETVRERIRGSVEDALVSGLRGRDLIAVIKDECGTWLSQAHAETIARTETAKMYNAGRIARWLDPENEGFVEALQYDAIVDTRTTDLCRSLDGKIIAISNAAAVAKYTPPNHFKCRATWIAVTKFEEWKDDFPLDEEPQKGFTFEAPLPHLLKGKKEVPLVQPKKDLKKDPARITNPDLIRSLPDADFKIAIGNITDQALKLSMIKERAEKMLLADKILEIAGAVTQFENLGVEDGLATFVMFDEVWTAPLSNLALKAWNELIKALTGADSFEAKRLIDEFAYKYADNPNCLGLIATLREAIGQAHSVQSKVKFNGFQKAERNKELTVKEPPRTASYKAATGLRQAAKDGSEWMAKYLDDKLVPETGIRMRFKHDLRRAYAIGAQGNIFFGKYETRASVIVHEAAHVMHWGNKAVADLTHEFFMKRTENMTIPKKTWSNSGGGIEWAYPDNFIDAYVGREYGWEKKSFVDQYATSGFLGQEVVSMGMQYMYEDPVKFYKKDKDHFLFIYALMKGMF